MSSGHLLDERDRSIRAHAAGIRPAIAVEQSLVILRRRQRDHALAVGQHEDGQLLALHELLDENRVARVAERSVLEHRRRG